MAEYIEREALIEKLETLLSDLRFIVKYEKQHGSVIDIEKSKAKLETVKEIINLIKSQPTADVQEVRHGKWELIDECANEGIYCSNCHKKVYRAKYANQKVESNYCPNCGAKMDKE